MLESVAIISNKKRTQINNNLLHNNKLIVDLSLVEQDSFDIEFIFKNTIVKFRNHDFTWVDCKKDRIATEFSPKILQLANNYFVQANINMGIWEISKQNPKILLWRFNPVNAYPIVNYTGDNDEKIIVQAKKNLHFNENPTLLFSSKNALEFSRSHIPFSAIVCFTDHCDFDTLDNLKIQRELFNKNRIKTTKGFFLNHYSKRNDNASFENDEIELNNWINDGHELAYHSLSQSIKEEEQSFEDFFSFNPPFNNLTTWIDHGYQPYNLSYYKNFKISDKAYSQNLLNKNIHTLWNYIDSGTATNSVINQLNPYHFTLHNFGKGNKNLKLLNRIGLLVKNIIFHFYADEKLIKKYESIALSFKKIIYQKDLKSIPMFLKSFYGITIPLLKVLFSWNKVKNKPYKNAKYSPLLFKHVIDDSVFTIFQTLEIIDFKKSLHPDNMDKLIAEKGIFIAHTYFSAPMKYHYGKIINDNKIDETVAKNFDYLGLKIKNNEIWNPTVNELINFLTNFDKIILDIDSNGNIIVVESFNYTYQQVAV